MVLPLKNFVKIKALDTPDKILNFYGLPLKNPLVLSWSGGVCVCVCVCVCGGGGGGEVRILNVIAPYRVNITQIF